MRIIPFENLKLSGKHYYFLGNTPFSGIAFRKYETGYLCFKKRLIDGMFNGEQVYFYKSGKLFCREIFINGEKRSSVEWYRNGMKKNLKRFKNGRPHGIQKAWHKTGTLKRIERFINGDLHGKQQEWYESGNKRSKEDFHHGIQKGDSLSWRENGILQNKTTYKKRLWWSENGNLSQVIDYYENGDYLVTEYHANGVLWVERLYKNNELLNIKNYDDIRRKEGKT